MKGWNMLLAKAKVYMEFDCKCHLKCTNKITDADRQKINDSFWTLSWEAKTTYIAQSVKSHLHYLNVNGETIHICKKAYMKTLNVESARIHRAMQKESNTM